MTAKKKKGNRAKSEKKPVMPPERIPDEREEETNNSNQHREISENVKPDFRNDHWHKIGIFVNILATVAIAVFTWQLTMYSSKQTEIYEFETLPYPLLAGVDMIDTLRTAEDFSVMITIRNLGKLPAYDYTSYAQWHWVEKDSEKDIIELKEPLDFDWRTQNKFALSPGEQGMPAIINAVLPAKHITIGFFDSLKTEKTHLFLKIFLRYKSPRGKEVISENVCLMYSFHRRNFISCIE